MLLISLTPSRSNSCKVCKRRRQAVLSFWHTCRWMMQLTRMRKSPRVRGELQNFLQCFRSLRTGGEKARRMVSCKTWYSLNIFVYITCRQPLEGSGHFSTESWFKDCPQKRYTILLALCTLVSYIYACCIFEEEFVCVFVIISNHFAS